MIFSAVARSTPRTAAREIFAMIASKSSSLWGEAWRNADAMPSGEALFAGLRIGEERAVALDQRRAAGMRVGPLRNHRRDGVAPFFVLRGGERDDLLLRRADNGTARLLGTLLIGARHRAGQLF